MELQVKLLRVLETGSFSRVGGVTPIVCDVRIIAASNREPERALADGKLREDLYHRLNVFPIRLPPLRQRGADIELLARHFLAELNRDRGHRQDFLGRQPGEPLPARLAGQCARAAQPRAAGFHHGR